MRRCYGRRISRAYRKRHTSGQRAAPLSGGMTLIRVVSVLAGLAVLGAALGDRVPATSSSTAASPPTAAPPVGASRSGLDARLQRALRAARGDAAAVGVKIVVTSGRRTRAHQQRLFDEAVAKYGSEQEAARWVASPDTSAHVS